MREIFWLQIYPFQAILSNFGFYGRKAPPPNEGKFFDFRSIHFRQFWATLVFVAEKPPPPRMRENFWLQIYPFQDNFEQLWFLWQKSPPPIFRQFVTLGLAGKQGKFFYTDLSISGNFQQLWFLWQKSPPPMMREIFFYTGSIHFRQFPATLGLVAEKPPPLYKFFLDRIYPFQAISSNFGFCGRKAPPPQDEGKIFDTDLSISGNFEQLWFLWQKSSPPPQDEGKFLTVQIYPFQAISSNFGFGGRKAPPPQDEGKLFYTDLSISGNFEQLWFNSHLQTALLGVFRIQIFPLWHILANGNDHIHLRHFMKTQSGMQTCKHSRYFSRPC